MPVNACDRCSLPGKPMEHGVEGCPREPRERPVLCRYASQAEFLAGLHTTWNLDRVCDRCKR